MMKYVQFCLVLAAVVVVSGSLLGEADARITKEMREEVLPQIEKGLASKDPVVQANAILAAGVVADRKMWGELEPFLENANARVRQAAIVAFVNGKNRKGSAALEKEIAKAGGGRFLLMSELLPLLDDRARLNVTKGWLTGRKVDAGVRKDALRWVAAFGTGKVYELLGAVTKAKGNDRKPWVDVLVANPRPKAFAWAQKLATNKKDAAARRDGIRLAVAIGGKKVDGLARKALNDSDPEVSSVAVEYLIGRGDPAATDHLVKSLNATPDDDREALIERILATGNKVPYAAANKLAKEKTDSKQLRIAYHRMLGATRDPKAIKTLIELEGSTEIDDRLAGVAGLGLTRSTKALGVLSKTVYDGNGTVRSLSAKGLGELGLDAAVPTLQAAINKTREKKLKYELIRSLGQIGTPAAGKVLMFLVRDRDEKVKMLALDGLAEVRDKQTRSVVEVLLRDRNTKVAWRATLLLLELDEKAGMAKLTRALQRPPENYMDDILALPKKLRDRVLLSLLKSNTKEQREDALDAVVGLGNEGRPLMRTVATGKFPFDVKSSCLGDLARFDNAEDVGLFKRIAQTGTEEEKLVALSWLARQSDKKLAGFLRTMMIGAKDKPPVKFIAMYGMLRAEA